MFAFGHLMMDMMVEETTDDVCAMQTVPILPYPSPLKRKSFICDGSGEYSDSEEVSEVLRRIKKIKFPVFITIRTLNGRVIEMDLDSNDSVERVKENLEELEGIPVHQQKLIFNGKQIQNDKTVNSYGIENGSVIFLVIALPHKHGYSGISSEHRNDK